MAAKKTKYLKDNKGYVYCYTKALAALGFEPCDEVPAEQLVGATVREERAKAEAERVNPTHQLVDALKPVLANMAADYVVTKGK